MTWQPSTSSTRFAEPSHPSTPTLPRLAAAGLWGARHRRKSVDSARTRRLRSWPKAHKSAHQTEAVETRRFRATQQPRTATRVERRGFWGMPASTTWDPSIIGLTPSEKSEMSLVEQHERAVEELNRAADILQAVASAFGEHFRPTERQIIAVAASAVIKVTRGT